MHTRFTIEQLEQMKTHELADLLANIVLVLRRLPNVECKQLGQMPEPIAEEAPVPSPTPISQSLTIADLHSKTVPQLKKIATELHVSYTGRTKKDELIGKILSRQAKGHSEQYAIQHL